MMICILGDWWQVIGVDSNSPYLLNDDDEYAYGCCDYIRHTIYIDEMLSGELLLEVLQHEVTHALCMTLHLGENISQEDVAIMCGKYADDINRICEELIDYF